MVQLQTSRLFLGPLIDSDAECILALRSDPIVNKFLVRAPMASLDEAITFIEKIKNGYAENNVNYWAIRLEKNGEFAGAICLWNFSEDNSSAELGYEMRPAFQGKGFMSEAIDKVIRHAFEDLKVKKLSAYTHKENQASIHLLTKAGFTGPFEPSTDYAHHDFIFILEQPS